MPEKARWEDALEFVDSCDDESHLAELVGRADRRLHQVRHRDRYGAGASKREAGWRPVESPPEGH